jgi:hypothetical protein
MRDLINEYKTSDRTINKIVVGMGGQLRAKRICAKLT